MDSSRGKLGRQAGRQAGYLSAPQQHAVWLRRILACTGHLNAAAFSRRSSTCILLPLCPLTSSPSLPPRLLPLVPTHRPSWDEQQHVEANYERAGLVADVNAAFGRNARRDVLREKAEADPAALEAEVQDDEFKAACAKVGGGAAPRLVLRRATMATAQTCCPAEQGLAGWQGSGRCHVWPKRAALWDVGH